MISKDKDMTSTVADKYVTSTENIKNKNEKLIEKWFEERSIEQLYKLLNFDMPQKNLDLKPEKFGYRIPEVVDLRFYDTDTNYSYFGVVNIIERILNNSTKNEVENFDEKEDSISSLKKQIKNCKNPMQLKELNQKLNAAYKKRRKKK